MCRLLRRRHAARQALQMALHTGGRALKLFEVLFGQTIEPECPGLVTKLLVHLMASVAPDLGNDRPDCSPLACKSSAQWLSAGLHLDQSSPDQAQSAEP